MNTAADGAASCALEGGDRRRRGGDLFRRAGALLWFAYYGNGAKSLIGDEQTYQAFALAILGGGDWMPSTIWPPLQSLFVAMIYATAGVHILAVQLVQTLLFVGCALLLRRIWRKVGGSVRGANVAAALFLLNPANAAYADWLWPEVHPSSSFCSFSGCCSAGTNRIARFRQAPQVFCSGLALLAKSLLAGFWPFFLIAFVRTERPRFRVAAAAVFVIGIALVTAPALWHGWRAYGRPMIADSSIYNLWIGLTDRWRVDYVDDNGGRTLAEFLASGATPDERNAVYLRKVDDVVAERGVMRIAVDQVSRQYFRLFSAKTPLVSQLPGPACAGHLSVYRASPATAHRHWTFRERPVPRADARRLRVRHRVLAPPARGSRSGSSLRTRRISSR